MPGPRVGAAHHVGVDPREVRDADVDAEVRDLRAQAVGERLDAGLARAVGRHERRVRDRRDGGDLQHVAAALDHVRQRRAHGAPAAEQVDLDDALPGGRVDRAAPSRRSRCRRSRSRRRCRRSARRRPATAASIAAASVTSASNQAASGPQSAATLASSSGSRPTSATFAPRAASCLRRGRADAARGAGDEDDLAGDGASWKRACSDATRGSRSSSAVSAAASTAGASALASSVRIRCGSAAASAS